MKIRGNFGGKRMDEKIGSKHNDTTTKLQKLVKKRKREIVIIKAGSIKRPNRSSCSVDDYYPSYAE